MTKRRFIRPCGSWPSITMRCASSSAGPRAGMRHGTGASRKAMARLYNLEVIDFRGMTDCAQAIEAKANELQRSIDLQAGPLLKLGLFRCTDGDHLLIAIHHLVVDGVSWRILLEDFAVGYEQALQGRLIRLPLKTDSFQTWAKQAR